MVTRKPEAHQNYSHVEGPRVAPEYQIAYKYDEKGQHMVYQDGVYDRHVSDPGKYKRSATRVLATAR